jgi:hypothetical protein
MSIELDHAKQMLAQLKGTADSAMRAIEAYEAAKAPATHQPVGFTEVDDLRNYIMPMLVSLVSKELDAIHCGKQSGFECNPMAHILAQAIIARRQPERESVTPIGWSVAPDNIVSENEWRDGFNGEHYTYDTGKQIMFIHDLTPNEFRAIRKLLTEGANIPVPEISNADEQGRCG